jgi:hypothetical protein
MNVREKLVELIDETLELYPSEREELADGLIAHGVTVQEWISVKDRLPENDYGKHWKKRKYYLVRLKPSGLMCVARYGYKEYGWWIDGHDCVLSATNFKEVTHWMELTNIPQPPKGE